MDLGEGKVYWEQYMQGKLGMQEIMNILGAKKVYFVVPGRMKRFVTIIAKLQRELMEFHEQNHPQP